VLFFGRINNGNWEMKLIAHRGNTRGTSMVENHPTHIENALKYFDCEIDVWWEDGWYLGHDEPTYLVPEAFLLEEGLWCHAKTIQTLYNLLKLGTHCFFHYKDAVTLTSRGYMWTYPGGELTSKSICVLPQTSGVFSKRPKCAGICSDEIVRYK